MTPTPFPAVTILPAVHIGAAVRAGGVDWAIVISLLALISSWSAIALTWWRYRTVDYPELTVGPPLPRLPLPADPDDVGYQVWVSWLHGELAAKDAMVVIRIKQDRFFLARLGDLGKDQFPLQMPLDLELSDRRACVQLGLADRPFLSSAPTPMTPPGGGESVVGIRWRCGRRLYWWGRLIEASGPGGGWRFVGDPLRSQRRWWRRRPSTGDVVAAVSLLFAAIAAGCAAWAIREARASGREQHRATQQLKATVTTLGEVLTQATQLVELEGQALRELHGLAREQHQAAEEVRLHRQVDRLTVVGERVEELGHAVETPKLEYP